MADTDTRIEQFRKMAAADPDNELGHFSLGRACLDAGLTDEAISAFSRVLQLNANISKAYQHLGEALLKKGDREAGVARLTEGVLRADSRGDLIPRGEMIRMLQELGAPVPELKRSAQAAEVGLGQVQCRRCGEVKSALPNPPYRNDRGKLIQQTVCADCWRQWIGMGTKVINELRLPLSDPQAQRIFEQHESEFLNLR